MRIIRDKEIVEDSFVHVEDEDDLPPGDIIVSLERFKRDHNALLARDGRLGVKLEPDEPPEEIADDLDRLGVVAINFPMFKDGRGYTYARRLRERHGYDGEIRAVGDVLRDQMFLMARAGFNAFEVREDRDIEDALNAFADFSVVYQPGADEPEPLFRRLRNR